MPADSPSGTSVSMIVPDVPCRSPQGDCRSPVMLGIIRSSICLIDSYGNCCDGGEADRDERSDGIKCSFFERLLVAVVQKLTYLASGAHWRRIGGGQRNRGTRYRVKCHETT